MTVDIWFCESCGVIGAIGTSSMEEGLTIRGRISDEHKTFSPDCPVNPDAIRSFSPPNITPGLIARIGLRRQNDLRRP